ncbi:hypothetical protein [Psychrobacter fozii]|uniref:Uncharacterized protein n=1 Tax=Psychrobacter fozii TaxID=198480 RepID=A0A2V4V7Q9_9GAMM|nr:hypothetical protein [Psychrobacter fozii]PYE38508.1 hypothetical protein DFP82_107131 [Psychrobacter fozii]
MNLDNKILLDISKELSESLSKKITRKTIKWMQSLDSLRDQYHLTNRWDDVCYQFQSEDFYYWHFYEDMIMEYVILRIEELNEHEANAIWLQTENSYDYLIEMDENEMAIDGKFEPLNFLNCIYDTVRYIVDEYICTQAKVWQNDKLRKQLKYDLDE